MIVDDELDVTDLFEGMLSNHFKVIKAFSGEEALVKIEVEKPDLILLDILMPEMDGWKVLNAIRQKDELKEIPVVILTAVKPDFSILQKGIDSYLVKPVTRTELISIVGEIFKSREEMAKYEAAALAGGVERELVDAYRQIKRQLEVNQGLLSTLKQIFTQRAMKNRKQERNLMKSFERAIDLQKGEVRGIQIEIEKHLKKER